MDPKRMFIRLAAAGAAVFAGNILSTLLIRSTGTGIIKKVEGQKGIALTFDDGPHPVYTGQLLDLLKKHQVKATFFVVGEKVDAHPRLVRRMKDEGHEIGIHHYEHRSNWRLSPRVLRRQIGMTDRAIRRAAGGAPVLYRPPWGRLSPFTLSVARNYDTVLWSHIFQDWKISSCRNLADRLTKVPEDGSVILLHDDGTNPGADDAAPAFMIRGLAEYLEDAVRRDVQFIPVKGRHRHGH
ncbi:polysaccharide deacetylase family protein [Bhargavaea cecembensis]|uniref:polysaccharide deacetylase family protein n=1 Tax=Bhargavaea cecembensis TaxID=394098 RepID=UPI000693D8A2|nr:polysaccharide deacetylase family protein [Bhargavaea cecembensis]